MLSVAKLPNKIKYVKERKTMAKNYTMTEVAEIFAAGTDAEAMSDIGKRYPMLAIKMSALMAKAADEVKDIFSYMPEYLSANKVNKAIKEGIGATDSDEDADVEEEQEEKPVKTAKAAKKKEEVDTSDTDYAHMPNAKLYKLLGDYGERKACKAEFGDLSKASMVAFLDKHHGDGVSEDVEADDEEWSEDAEDKVKYEDMSAQELFKECKKRGLKAAPKKTAKVYIELLKKADAEAEAEEAEEDADDWGDEDDDAEEEKPVKKAPEKKPAKKAPAKKPAKKAPAKKVEQEEDEDDAEDDDWDI